MTTTRPPLAARPLRPHERPALLAAINRVFRPAGDVDLARVLPSLLGPRNLARLRVVEEQGRIAAHAGVCLRDAMIDGRSIRCAMMGCVYTEPDARGRGLATQAVADAHRVALDEGGELVLVSGAGPLYQRLGFEVAPPMTRFTAIIEPDHTSRVSLDVEPVGAVNLPAVRALHDIEPARFVRGEEHWRAILDSRWLIFGVAEIYLVRRNGAPVATLAVERGRVLEYTGDRNAVVEAAASLAPHQGAPPSIWQRPGDAALAEAAIGEGLQPESFAFPMSFAWRGAGRTPTLPWYGFDYV